MLLRIFIGESDRFGSRPLYEEIIIRAHNLGLAGATATRGIMSFGADSRMHSAKVLRLAEDLPVIIELVDIEENLNKLLPFLDENVKEGLITMEHVKVLKYHNKKSQD